MEATLLTERLMIEPLKLTDCEFMLELINTDGWINFIGNRNIDSLEQSIIYIQKILRNENYSYLVLRLIENQTPIGIVSLIKRNYLDHLDIGFALLPSYETQGYAFEASQKVLEHLTKSKMHSEIFAITLKENVKSISLLEKLGMEFVREVSEDNEELLVFSRSLI